MTNNTLYEQDFTRIQSLDVIRPPGGGENIRYGRGPKEKGGLPVRQERRK